MTRIIGLTGGIGSGKTTVAKMFENAGVSVYNADDRAKAVSASEEIEKKISDTFGPSIVSEGIIDRKKLANLVFNDAEKLAQLNAIVHPAVRKDFQQWLAERSDEDFIIREAAILFESGAYKDCNQIITVTAPEEIRIERVMKRNGISREEVLSRIKNQWPDQRKIEMSDYVIGNIGIYDTEREVVKILKTLKNVQ